MLQNQTQAERLAFLRSLFLFEHFDETLLNRETAPLRETTYTAGQTVFPQGEHLDTAVIVISGSIALSLASEEGKEVIIRELTCGDIFGEIELITGGTTQCEACAQTRTRVLRITHSVFERLLEDATFTRKLLLRVCSQVREILDFTETTSLYTLETRLARLLIKLGDQDGRNVDGGILIDRPISQSVIGQMINASRPKINLQMRRWHVAEFIRVQGSRITILDPDALSALSRPMR
ncbi:Crp/Fnr family transcriptional regulator [Stappia sp. ES.058]|uniref:Crp/Fnr family transcriptional regulator n=1 Tax=Stappia sp. ES.058 TaxID=1881061 RepID=UPI00087ADB0B|nr:Crp/Fnr family transcriptional regulator [Stappia sp. ES.058]SDT91594.1 cAMP-binding domain of CRP or a regulatory subunit of cAMP-dependent protein kinases [Stappia sp. ES.058]